VPPGLAGRVSSRPSGMDGARRWFHDCASSAAGAPLPAAPPCAPARCHAVPPAPPCTHPHCTACPAHLALRRLPHPAYPPTRRTAAACYLLPWVVRCFFWDLNMPWSSSVCPTPAFSTSLAHLDFLWMRLAFRAFCWANGGCVKEHTHGDGPAGGHAGLDLVFSIWALPHWLLAFDVCVPVALLRVCWNCCLLHPHMASHGCV